MMPLVNPAQCGDAGSTLQQNYKKLGKIGCVIASLFSAWMASVEVTLRHSGQALLFCVEICLIF